MYKKLCTVREKRIYMLGEPRSEGISEKEAISAAQRVQSLMRTIGNSKDTHVRVGPPGSENHFDPVGRYTQIDSQDLLRHEDEWMGIGAHEAMHCRITRWEFIPDEVLQDPGFNQLLQTIEDVRVYQGVKNMFEGAAEWLRDAVAAEGKEKGRLSLKKLEEELGGELGYVPNALRYCVETQLSRIVEKKDPNLPVAVSDALAKTNPHLDQILADIPHEDATEEEIWHSAKRSYETIRDHIWPEFKKLIERDKENEELRQLMLHLVSVEGKGAKEVFEYVLEGNEKKEFSDLVVQVEQHVRNKQARDAARDAAARAEEETGERRSSSMRFMDLDKLSPQVRKKLIEAKKELLDKTKQKDLDDKTENLLNNIEDKIVEKLRGKLVSPKNIETHSEFKYRVRTGAVRKPEEAPSEVVVIPDEEDEDSAKIMSYDEAYLEVQSFIEDLYLKLDPILSPNKFPHWKQGYPTGGRANMNEAMQFEADPRRYNRLMERKTVPHRRDFRFTLLVDLSGSMRNDQKIYEAFKTCVLLAEVLDRLGIEFEILGFNTFPENEKQLEKYIFKEYEKPFTKENKDKMETMTTEVRSHDSGANDDGLAVRWASERLEKHSGLDNFLLVISDGQPAYSFGNLEKPENELHKAVADVMKKHTQHLLGLGIGEGGVDAVKEYYPNNKIVPNVKELSETLSELLEDMIENPEKYRLVR